MNREINTTKIARPPNEDIMQEAYRMYSLLNEITKYVSVIMKVNLRRLVFESQDSIFSGEMDLMVHEKADLERLLKMLQKIDGIQKVIRKNL